MTTTYTVGAEMLQLLNTIVGQQGGVIPTEVSNALGALQAASAAGDTAEAEKQFNIAVAANQKNGAAWSNVQAWHDRVLTSGSVPNPGGGAEPPPPYAGHTYVEPGTGGTLNIDATWGDPTRIESIAHGGFPPDGAVVVHFHTPESFTMPTTSGWAQTAEFQGAPVFRHITLSTEPGMFEGPSVLAASNNGGSPQVQFPDLEEDTDYFVNVRNYYPGMEPKGCTCTAGYECNLLVQFHWPV